MEVFTGIDAEGERARTLREWAQYEIDYGGKEKGAMMWEEARAIFEQLGMTFDLERMQR